MVQRRRELFLLVLLPATLALAKDYSFTPPRVFHAKTYAAHDAHDQEKVSLAADPYDLADKQALVFKKVDFLGHGFLPLELIISNDGAGALALGDMQVTLVTRSKHARITPATPDDIYRRISQQTMHDTGPSPVSPRARIHLPQHLKDSVSKPQRAEVEQSMWAATSVGPLATEGGFFYFDVDGIDEPLAGAHLEITGIRRDGKELFYFELPMEDYLSNRHK